MTSASVLSRAQFFDHIAEVLDAFEPTLRARYGEERAEAAEDQREGEGDRFKTYRIAQNLLANTLKATERGGG